MVDCGGLENRFPDKIGDGGSNPSLSASLRSERSGAWSDAHRGEVQRRQAGARVGWQTLRACGPATRPGERAEDLRAGVNAVSYGSAKR